MTIFPYTLTRAYEVFFISKNKFKKQVENLPIPIFRPLRSSRADWHQHQKVGAQKLEKCEGGCVGFRDPKFLNEKKSKSTMQKTVCNLVEGKWVKIERF